MPETDEIEEMLSANVDLQNDLTKEQINEIL